MSRVVRNCFLTLISSRTEKMLPTWGNFYGSPRTERRTLNVQIVSGKEEKSSWLVEPEKDAYNEIE